MKLAVNKMSRTWCLPRKFKSKREEILNPTREDIRQFWEILRKHSGTVSLVERQTFKQFQKNNPGQSAMVEVDPRRSVWSVVASGNDKLRLADGLVNANYVTIDGIVGEYFMIQVEHEGGLWLLVDESKEVTVYNEDNPAETLGIGCGECLEHNTINDFDHAIKMVDSFLDSGEFVDDAPYAWLSHQDDIGDRLAF